MKAVLSPRELAQVIGVSESSLKRWADAGLLDVSRTAGGHRRISLPEAVRFIHETRATLVRPDVLGLPDIDGSLDLAEEGRDPGERLYQFLVDGQARSARAMILTLYLGGRTVAEICDEPIRFALGRIGEAGHDRHEAIYLEHRATDVCVQALSQLRLLFQPPAAAPVAVGCAPAGDPYLLPSMMAATILAAEGWNAINLGPDTPEGALRHAVKSQKPGLVWLSATSEAAATARRDALIAVTDEIVSAGMTVVVGGRCRAVVGERTRPQRRLFLAATMGELAALARGLHVA
jgi:MerR family transcriptional regulator, light-induced transcriptional regulator